MSVKEKTPLERLFDLLCRHPYLSVCASILLLFFFGYCEVKNLTLGSYIYAFVVSALLFAALTFIGKLGRNHTENIVIFAFSCVFSGGALYLIYATDNSTALMLWLFLVAVALLAVMFKATGTLNTRTFIMLMIAAGIVLRFVYVLYTDSTSRQHDVGFFNWTWGHANYIEYWYKNGLKLPDFDVRSIWQYYHPPLHHWLMALSLKLFTLLGMEYDAACQAMQVLPLLYSSLILVVSYRIFRWVRLKGLSLIIATAIMCFHPTFVLMGGFFNNDTLSVLFIMLSILFALKWYREPTLKRILPIALCVGLGMMTKLSAWMVAPAIALLFLYIFVKNIKKWKGFIGQFALFILICAPLGLWWQVRNLITFNVPLTYVPYLSEQDATFCGNLSVTQRLFDFSGKQLSYVFDAFTGYGAPYDEYNPTLGLFKTSLFGEGTNGVSSVNFPSIAVTGTILFWIGLVLGLFCFVSFVIMMIRKDSGLDGLSRAFFSVLAATFLICFYIFCFKFPFTCTMNIRYCAPLIPLFAMGLGLLLKRFSGDSTPQKILKFTAAGLVILFAVMTCVVYSQVGVLPQ